MSTATPGHPPTRRRRRRPADSSPTAVSQMPQRRAFRVFFDHMLETVYPAGKGMNIRQHPHIGLSTLTYLFEGQIQHKDSLGSDQVVSAGDVSWMTAGSAIAHVERTPEPLKESGFKFHGLQIWLASPKEHEQGPGHYSHHPASTLPVSDKSRRSDPHDRRVRLLPRIASAGAFSYAVRRTTRCRRRPPC
jgi:redox-sensitive bicupin YhaK (pirin superfamily)